MKAIDSAATDISTHETPAPIKDHHRSTFGRRKRLSADNAGRTLMDGERRIAVGLLLRGRPTTTDYFMPAFASIHHTFAVWAKTWPASCTTDVVLWLPLFGWWYQRIH